MLRVLTQMRMAFLKASRGISTTSALSHGDFEMEDPKSEDEVVNITFVLRDGTEKSIRGKVGDNVMYLAHRYNIELEGACDASLACSTCHVYVENGYYSKLKEPVEEEEVLPCAETELFIGHAGYGASTATKFKTQLPNHLEQRARWLEGGAAKNNA